MKRHGVCLAGLLALIFASPTYAQLDKVFNRVFDQVLREDLKLSPGVHARHYFDAAASADMVLTPGLNALIAGNVSSFPLTSTIAGVTYDFSTGRPVPITESLGPIFAETAETLGKSKLNLGFEYTYLNLNKFRGLDTKDIRFTFAHEDVLKDGKPLGDDPFELDLIDVNLGLDASASIFAFFLTFGVLNNFDVGVAVPVVNVGLSGEAQAVIRGPSSGIFHSFAGGTARNPNVLVREAYDESATGLGDIALRLKYSLVRGPEINLGWLVDVRLPTGKKEDFLGTGETNVKIALIASRKIAQFTPHLNLGYDRRPGALDSDELEFIAGFDQKMAEGLTLAVDFLGEIDVTNDDDISFFPEETLTIVEKQPGLNLTINRLEDLTNIPQRGDDNTLSASFGVRVAPSENVLFLGNILVPMNDGGLRSSVAPTLGVTVNF